jgi:hypothetical protein
MLRSSSLTGRVEVGLQGIWFYGLIQVTDIFNFSQDDLLTEDMVILDTHGEGFHLDWAVCVEPKEKQEGIFRGLHLVRLTAVGTLKSYSKVLEYEYRVKTAALSTLK